MQISRRRTVFGLLAFAETVPAPKLAEAFDLSTVGDVSQAAGRPPALFGSRERVIAKPAHLLPGAPKVKRAKPEDDGATAPWLEMLDGLRPFNAKGRIAGVNCYLNGTDAVAGIARHARAEPWAAPFACLATDGESEDTAIAKFLSLRRLGFHPDRLRVVWVEDRADLTRHAVLAVIAGERPLILEHRFGDITTDAMLPGYLPYCSINQTRFSLHWEADDPKGVMASFDRLRRSAGRAAA